MSTQTISRSAVDEIHPVERDVLTAYKGHEKVHTRPQHGCDRCPPTECSWCGWSQGTCPEAWEHSRLAAGSETSWRRAA